MGRHLKNVLSTKAILLLFGLGCGLPFVAGQQVNRPKAKAEAAPPAKGKSFVIDTVRFAVSLSQPDPQDRLRVLAAAIPVISAADRRLTRALVNEGVRVEGELI